MSDIKPYTISFPEKRISDLKERLHRAIYPDELEGAGWDQGTPLDDVQRLTQYWSEKFDFGRAQANLNSLSNFTTTISVDGFDDLSIHFVHQKSDSPHAIPLLFSHGWPGSFIEVTKILPRLTKRENNEPAFHIIAPSLPNFGFSAGVKKRGFGIEQYAEVCHKLMLKLGYAKYITQGGDWGWYVTRTMSLLYPSSVIATHFNMDVGKPPAARIQAHPNNPFPLPPNPTSRELQGKARSQWFEQESYGYNALQSSKPQTIAYALTDSPIALLAWIYEKLHDWSDGYPWTDDEICTWVSIYWFSTAGPGAAGRIYYEMEHDKHGGRISRDDLGDDFEGAVPGTRKITRGWLWQDHGTGVKIGQSHFPNDIHVLPSTWTRTIGDVVFERDHEDGGHFAAWEKSDELVQDLRDMFGKGTEARLAWERTV